MNDFFKTIVDLSKLANQKQHFCLTEPNLILDDNSPDLKYVIISGFYLTMKTVEELELA